MQQINYVGEHLWVGQIGHFAILLSFVAAAMAAWFYYHSRSVDKDLSWLKLARASFYTHAISTFVVIGLLFYAMFSRMYEYIAVYRTVSDDSPREYLLAAFWQDQEGSFLLWMFWHIVLAFIVIKKHAKWEAPVLMIISLVQLFLMSMLLGLYVPFLEADMKIGSNPFALIRDVFEAPIFANADYLTLVKGKGLNPLLQNYWMIIHPPVIFLGFASTLLPFAFSMAGVSSDKFKEVLPVLLKWALFSGAILGLGILMGGAWAYVALTFGGYWAWDPVENSSLVPWLFVVAGIHTTLIARATGHSQRSAFMYYFLTFVFTLFSTFLTRSGVLGDTSVHAFTSLGLESQLGGFILFFVLIGMLYLIRYGKNLNTTNPEEATGSREFWMYIGSLILLLSGIMMTISTSLPLYNKIVQIFKPDYVGIVLTDPVHHHNQYQIWIGIMIGILMGTTMLLRYKETRWSDYFKTIVNKLLIITAVSLVLSVALQPGLRMFSWQQIPLLFAGIFTIIANAYYLYSQPRRNIKNAGSIISHIGFGVLILGILVSGLNKRTISTNPFGQGSILEEQSAQRALILIKEEPFFATDYWMTYVGDTLKGNLREYIINFKKVNRQNEMLSEHQVKPSAIYESDFTKIAAFNPGTIRRVGYDIFTAAAPPPHMQDIDIARAAEDSLRYLSYMVAPGDIIEEENYSLEIGELVYDYPFSDHMSSTDYDLTLGVPIKIFEKRRNKHYDVIVGLGLKDGVIYQFPQLVNALSMKFKIADNVFSKIYSEEADLNYEELKFKLNETVRWREFDITLTGFNRNPQNKNYVYQEGDIALGAYIDITKTRGNTSQSEPIFVLRNAQPFSIKAYHPEEGLHLRFTSIEPNTEVMTFRIAQDLRKKDEIELLAAVDAPRNDLLIVEATIIPGINLVWGGCLMMLFGLLLALLAKRGISADN